MEKCSVSREPRLYLSVQFFSMYRNIVPVGTTDQYQLEKKGIKKKYSGRDGEEESDIPS